MTDTGGRTVGKPDYNPLYLQVKRQLVERIAGGEWPPGSVLPSEQQLAAEMEVSQGTVRKALDAMASENLLVRRQGRGTFVAEHDQQQTLFRFFRITADNGRPLFPEAVSTKMALKPATARERKLLGLPGDGKVWRIRRHRALDGRVLLVERIVLPAPSFPDLDRHEPLPNNVYRLYEQDYAIIITRAHETLKSVAASDDDAAALGCASGAPVLGIDRVAYALTGQAVELRETICLTDTIHYRADLH